MGGRPGNLVPRHWLSSAGVYDHVSKGMKTALVGLLAAYFVLIEGKSMSRNANNEANNAKNTCSLRMDCGDSSQTDNGISVVMGPKGERGPQGPTGDKGCDGGKGDKGEKGEPGVKGQDGLPGLPDRPTNPVAFSVAQATNRDSSDLSRNSETIPYDTVLTNIGDAYNNVTGRFKAPVKGTFFFTVTMAAQKRKEAGGELTTSGKGSIARVWAISRPEWGTASNMFILNLEAEEEVWVKPMEPAPFMYQNKYCTFSGFLLYPMKSATLASSGVGMVIQ